MYMIVDRNYLTKLLSRHWTNACSHSMCRQLGMQNSRNSWTNAACQARLIEYYLQHELNQYVLHTTIMLLLLSWFLNLICFQQPSLRNGHWLGKGRLCHTSNEKCAKQLLIENDKCASHAPSKTWTTNCATVGHSNTEMLFIWPLGFNRHMWTLVLHLNKCCIPCCSKMLNHWFGWGT